MTGPYCPRLVKFTVTLLATDAASDCDIPPTRAFLYAAKRTAFSTRLLTFSTVSKNVLTPAFIEWPSAFAISRSIRDRMDRRSERSLKYILPPASSNSRRHLAHSPSPDEG